MVWCGWSMNNCALPMRASTRGLGPISRPGSRNPAGGGSKHRPWRGRVRRVHADQARDVVVMAHCHQNPESQGGAPRAPSWSSSKKRAIWPSATGQRLIRKSTEVLIKPISARTCHSYHLPHDHHAVAQYSAKNLCAPQAAASGGLPQGSTFVGLYPSLH